MEDKRILIVDDNSNQRVILRTLLSRRGFKVQLANNGIEALNKIKENNFDIVITDWLMPEMDGMELTEKIRLSTKKQPIIILLTAINSKEAKRKALFAGADQYAAKPLEKENLLQLIEVSLLQKNFLPEVPDYSEFKTVKAKVDFYCVGIAASTGGPQTLSNFFNKLGVVKNTSFLVVQHGQAWMLESFVNTIQRQTKMPVFLGEDGLEVVPGVIYIAPGKRHMIIDEDTLRIKIIDTPPENYVKPSADPLFKSIASVFGKLSRGIVFTGMGSDGSYGSGYIKAAGGIVIVEDPRTAILKNMPENVINFNLADRIVHAENIPAMLRLSLK